MFYVLNYLQLECIHHQNNKSNVASLQPAHIITALDLGLHQANKRRR